MDYLKFAADNARAQFAPGESLAKRFGQPASSEAALRTIYRQFGPPSGLPQLQYLGQQWAAGNKISRAEAEAHVWRAHCTGPDTARITDGRRVVEGTFTPGHAHAVADALNSRDLVKAVGVCLGLGLEVKP